MTLKLELSPEQEARLTRLAQHEGLDPVEVVKRLVTDHLPELESDTEPDPTLALFAQWDREDQNLTQVEIDEENRTWEDFKTNINAERDRAGTRRAF